MTGIIAMLGAVIVERAAGSLADVANWARHVLEENNMAGPKEQAALDALDDAVGKLQEWRDADDENDAARINSALGKVNQVMQGANDGTSHLPTDQNGDPVEPGTGPGSDAGPASPVTSAGNPGDSDSTESTEDTADEDNDF